MTGILIAIPTNGQRPDALERTMQMWTERTPAQVTFHVTTYGSSWCAGLNDAYRAHPDAETFIAASDDMYPENDLWLEIVTESLDRDESPVPLMLDPRFTLYAGCRYLVQEGAPVGMTNFPVLKNRWLKPVFEGGMPKGRGKFKPLSDDLHYYGDNEIADRLHAIGVPTVARLGFVIRHEYDERGRGAGYKSEDARMQHDRKVYLRA